MALPVVVSAMLGAIAFMVVGSPSDSSCSLWWRNDKGGSRAEAPKETGAPEGARAPKGETSAQFIASETKRRSGPRNPWTKSGGDRTGNPHGLYPLDETRTPGLW